MKKIYSYVFATVAIFATVACNKENAEKGVNAPVHEVPADAVEKTFPASLTYAEPVAKTTISGKTSLWSGTENIAVLGNYYYKFTATLDTPSASAEFSCASYSAGETAVLAVYPHADNYTYNLANKTVSNVVIPTQQYAPAGSYDPAAHIAVAYSDGGEVLEFKNAVALFKFTCNAENISKVCLYADESKGDCVTGKGTLSYNNGEPTFTSSTKKHWVDVYPEKGKTTFTVGNTYYFAVAPGTYANGFTFEITTGGNNIAYKKTTKSQNFASGLLFDLGEIVQKKVYLRPGIWADAKAWFFAHFFEGSVSEVDVKMSDPDGDGILEATVPFGLGKVIFVRMNPEATTIDWNKKWNESAQLALPTGTSVCYSVNDWNSMKWETLDEARKSMLYLKPNSNWTQGSARFAAYFFKDGGGNSWRTMTDWNKDGIYEVSKPTSNNTKMIFCRMNPNNNDNRWNNNDEGDSKPQWNKTGDLTIPTDGKNLFTLPNNSWDGATTTWSKKTF